MNIDILHTISEYCSITDYIKILKYIKTNEYILQKLVERYKKDRQRWLLIINDNLISSRKDTHLKKWVEKINTLKYDLHESNIYNIYQFFYYIYQDIKNLQMKCTICNKKTEYNCKGVCHEHGSGYNKKQKLQLDDLFIIDKFLKSNIHLFRKYYPSKNKVIKTYSLRSRSRLQ